ncbi:MAG: YbbR-like domain-containing protein [bacterium]
MSVEILSDYKVKLVIFLFAIFIWFFVITENVFEHVIDVPIIPVNITENKVILNKLPKTARVKINGTGKDLIALSVTRGVRLDLDLSNVERRKTFSLEPQNVFFSRVSGSLATQEIITPDSVTVILDDFKIKKVSIYPKIKLTTADGYTNVGGIQIRPDSAMISGPQSLVSQVKKIYTVDEALTDIRFDVRKKIALAPVPYEKVTCNLTEVEIYINIQKLLEITLTGVPIEIRNAPRNMKVSVVPSTLSLVLEGGGDLLTQISRNDIVAYIDYHRAKLLPSNEIPAAIDTPGGVSYRDVKPKTFKLVLERRSSN